MDYFSGINNRKPTAPCPMCHEHEAIDEIACIPCGHTFTAQDIRLRDLYVQHHERKGVRYALIFFPALFLIFIAFFYYYG